MAAIYALERSDPKSQSYALWWGSGRECGARFRGGNRRNERLSNGDDGAATRRAAERSADATDTGGSGWGKDGTRGDPGILSTVATCRPGDDGQLDQQRDSLS